jgi:hypothetical protein
MSRNQDTVALFFPNHCSNTATITHSEGWHAQYPASNMLDILYAKKAVAILPTVSFSVKFYSVQRCDVVSLASHNLSELATWRVRGYLDSELKYDSGERYIWEALHDSSELEWESDSFWFGTLSREDREFFTPLAYLILPETHTLDSITIDIHEPAPNTISIGRVFCAPLWQPRINAAYGQAHGIKSSTDMFIAEDINKTVHFDNRTPRRTMSMDLNVLDEDEGKITLLGMQRRLDISGEVMYMPTPAFSPSNYRLTMIARMVTLNPLVHDAWSNFKNSINLEEIL